MKVFTFLILAVLGAATASAQPIRDMVDALAAARAHEREMQPAIEQVREYGLVLNMYGNVQRELSNATQPQIAFDKAISDIDEYLADVARRGAPLDRDLRLTIDRTRRFLDTARNPPVQDVTVIRETIHHNTIHPLQRRALMLARQVEGLIRTYETLAMSLRGSQLGVLAQLEKLATDPEKP
jgi:hypothetical protein